MGTKWPLMECLGGNLARLCMRVKGRCLYAQIHAFKHTSKSVKHYSYVCACINVPIWHSSGVCPQFIPSHGHVLLPHTLLEGDRQQDPLSPPASTTHPESRHPRPIWGAISEGSSGSCLPALLHHAELFGFKAGARGEAYFSSKLFSWPASSKQRQARLKGNPLRAGPSTGLILEAGISWRSDRGLEGTVRSGRQQKQGTGLAVYGLLLRAQVGALPRPARFSVPQFPHPQGGMLLPHETTGMVTSRLQMATRKEKFISIS